MVAFKRWPTMSGKGFWLSAWRRKKPYMIQCRIWPPTRYVGEGEPRPTDWRCNLTISHRDWKLRPTGKVPEMLLVCGGFETQAAAEEAGRRLLDIAVSLVRDHKDIFVR